MNVGFYIHDGVRNSLQFYQTANEIKAGDKLWVQ